RHDRSGCGRLQAGVGQHGWSIKGPDSHQSHGGLLTGIASEPHLPLPGPREDWREIAGTEVGLKDGIAVDFNFIGAGPDARQDPRPFSKPRSYAWLQEGPRKLVVVRCGMRMLCVPDVRRQFTARVDGKHYAERCQKLGRVLRSTQSPANLFAVNPALKLEFAMFQAGEGSGE